MIFFSEGDRLDSEKTQQMLSERLKGMRNVVVPGFYGSDVHGNIRTFSRGGSDITGALVARAVDADV